MKKKTPTTIKFRRYGSLPKVKVRFRKNFAIDKKHRADVDILKKTTEEVADGMAAVSDYYAREILERGLAAHVHIFGNDAYGTSRLQRPYTLRRYWQDFTYWISRIRIRLAEWIGGSELHSNCGDW